MKPKPCAIIARLGEICGLGDARLAANPQGRARFVPEMHRRRSADALLCAQARLGLFISLGKSGYAEFLRAGLVPQLRRDPNWIVIGPLISQEACDGVAGEWSSI